MNRSSQSRINAGLVGVVMGVGAIAIALGVSGKGIDRAHQLKNKSADRLSVYEVVTGCSLNDEGEAIVQTWDSQMVAKVLHKLDDPDTCQLVEDHIELMQRLGPEQGKRLQTQFKQELGLVEIDM